MEILENILKDKQKLLINYHQQTLLNKKLTS